MRKSFRFVVGWTCLMLLGTASGFGADLKSTERQTTFNNITDFFATLGKSPRESSIIKKERRSDRKQQRLKNEIRRNQAQSRQRMQQQAEDIIRKEQAGYTK